MSNQMTIGSGSAWVNAQALRYNDNDGTLNTTVAEQGFNPDHMPNRILTSANHLFWRPELSTPARFIYKTGRKDDLRPLFVVTR